MNSHNEAQISWKVNEINTATYNAEKSSDGISFNSIASITSKGNAVNTYQYTDNLKLTGSLFYRIKQTDNDGKFKYSSVIALNGANAIALSLFPNPASDHVFISGLANNATYHVSITDMSGKTIITGSISAAQNKIVTSALSKGIYLVRITAADYYTTLKLVKE